MAGTVHDVALALAGAPIGALIAVGGVYWTQKATVQANRDSLAAQMERERERMQFDLVSEIQRDTLRNRREIYEAVLEKCDRARRMREWAFSTPDELPIQGEITNEDIWENLSKGLGALKYRVMVNCAQAVREAFAIFATEVGGVDETSDDEWNSLKDAADLLESTVILAALDDRSGGVADEELRGM